MKISLTKNPKKRPAAERLLFHPFVLAGDLTARLSLDLLQKVNLYYFNRCRTYCDYLRTLEKLSQYPIIVTR